MAIFGAKKVRMQTVEAPGGADNLPVIPFFLSTTAVSTEDDVTQVDAREVNDATGVLTAVFSKQTEQTSSITFTTEVFGWNQLAFVLDEPAQRRALVELDQDAAAVVPTGTPEIVNPAFTPANAGRVLVGVTERGAYGEIGFVPVVSGVPTGRQVQLDTANTKLVFPADFAGKNVKFVVPEDLNNVQTIGGQVSNASVSLGTLSCFFEVEVPSLLYPQGLFVKYPQLSRTALPSIDFAGGPTSVDIEFTAGVPVGWSKPFQLVNPAAVATTTVS